MISRGQLIERTSKLREEVSYPGGTLRGWGRGSFSRGISSLLKSPRNRVRTKPSPGRCQLQHIKHGGERKVRLHYGSDLDDRSCIEQFKRIDCLMIMSTCGHSSQTWEKLAQVDYIATTTAAATPSEFARGVGDIKCIIDNGSSLFWVSRSIGVESTARKRQQRIDR